MIVRRSLMPTGFAAAVVFAGLTLPSGSGAQDIRHMCSEKYQAAKAAGTLGGESWPQFYSRCTAELKANPPAGAASAPTPEVPPPLDVRHICSQKYQAAKAAGSLGGESWPQFYSRCTAEVKANPAAAAVAPPTEKAPEAPPPAPIAEEPAPAPPAPVAEEPVPPPPAVAETPPPLPAPAAPSPPAKAPTPVNPLKKPAAKAPAAAAPATPGTAVFPTAIAPEFANEKPAKARMKTCQKQYNANKAANANGGLKWIQKGDGYWSECNKRLKG
jgi:hypothetical protein